MKRGQSRKHTALPPTLTWLRVRPRGHQERDVERFWKHVHGRVGRMAGGRGDSSSDDEDDLILPRHRATTSSTSKPAKVLKKELPFPLFRAVPELAPVLYFVAFPSPPGAYFPPAVMLLGFESTATDVVVVVLKACSSPGNKSLV